MDPCTLADMCMCGLALMHILALMSTHTCTHDLGSPCTCVHIDHCTHVPMGPCKPKRSCTHLHTHAHLHTCTNAPICHCPDSRTGLKPHALTHYMHSCSPCMCLHTLEHTCTCLCRLAHACTHAHTRSCTQSHPFPHSQAPAHTRQRAGEVRPPPTWLLLWD